MRVLGCARRLPARRIGIPARELGCPRGLARRLCWRDRPSRGAIGAAVQPRPDPPNFSGMPPRPGLARRLVILADEMGNQLEAIRQSRRGKSTRIFRTFKQAA